MYKVVNGKRRIFYLDQLRALAIMLVILAHVCRLFSGANVVGSRYWYLSTPLIDFAIMGVPLFLMISGSLLLNRDYELGDFLKRRFSRIIVPAIPWGILLPFWLMLVNNAPWVISSFVSVCLDKQYWFVCMLIGVYLFLPVLNSFVREFNLRGLEYFLMIWFFTLCLDAVGLYPFHQLELSYFAGFLGYFALGYYLSNKKFNVSDNALILVGFILFVVFTLINIHYTLTVGIEKGVMTYCGYKSLVVVLQSMGVFLIFRYWASYSSKNPASFKSRIYSLFKDSALFKIVFAIGTFSYGIFLVHYFPLYLMKYANEVFMPILSWNPIIWLPIVYFIIFFATLLFLIILDRIPILRQFSGSH